MQFMYSVFFLTVHIVDFQNTAQHWNLVGFSTRHRVPSLYGWCQSSGKCESFLSETKKSQRVMRYEVSNGSVHVEREGTWIGQQPGQLPYVSHGSSDVETRGMQACGPPAWFFSKPLGNQWGRNKVWVLRSQKLRSTKYNPLVSQMENWRSSKVKCPAQGQAAGAWQKEWCDQISWQPGQYFFTHQPGI